MAGFGVSNINMSQCGTAPDLKSNSGIADAAPTRPRILLADDHPEVLAEIGRRLAVECDVLGSATEGLALVQAASGLRPDAVISDISMPGLTGIEACRRILQAGFSKNAILLTMHGDPELIRIALEAGIRGYVLKVDAGEELISAVKTVLLGKTYLSRSLSKKRAS